MKVNALKIRQKFGDVLSQLEKLDEPIIIEKDRKPVAVLISLKMFEARFVDFQDAEKKRKLLESFKDCATTAKKNSLTVLRDLRYG